jgi:hypothetical protein
MLAGNAAEVGERAAVAVEERAQVLAGREAAERVTRVGQRHVERVDLRHALLEQDLAFVAPVDLGLRPGEDLEPPVQPRQSLVAVVLAGQTPTGLGDIQLDSLVVAAEAVLGDQPLVDHAGLEAWVGGQPGIDHRRDRVDLAGHRALPRRRGRRPGRRLGRQVLLDGAPVHTDLIGDLAPGRTGGTQRLVAA